MAADRIPEGFQQTEVGVIPGDWDPVPIGEIIEFQGGSQPPIEYFKYQESDGFIRLIQIRDYKSDKNKTYIPKKLARRFCEKDDIMIGRYGPPIFQILRGIEGAYNVALIKAIPTKRAIKDYCYHLLKQESIFLFVEKLSQRTGGQTGIDLNELRNYVVPLPPTLAEQNAIAAALSDMDALIEGLERLIGKKRGMKQGAMQELLTGKRRLAGFGAGKGMRRTEVGVVPEDWGVKPLGEIVDFLDGQRKPIKSSDRAKMQGVYPYYGASGIIDYVNDYLFDDELILLGEDGENIISRNLRLAFVVSGKIWVNNHAHVLKSKEGHDTHFVAEKLESMDFEQYNTGTAQPKLNKQTCSKIPLALPPTLAEQRAIARALSDMDAEIGQLEAQLAKYRRVKEGMMQELLTGKKRLV